MKGAFGRRRLEGNSNPEVLARLIDKACFGRLGTLPSPCLHTSSLIPIMSASLAPECNEVKEYVDHHYS